MFLHSLICEPIAGGAENSETELQGVVKIGVSNFFFALGIDPGLANWTGRKVVLIETGKTDTVSTA